jgi:hypothetical protein
MVHLTSSDAIGAVVSASMERLCGRPGCSEAASVAYGMRAADLVFWLDALAAGAPTDGGVLCRRHADTMVVPRGWTLDDLRDPDLHLFRPPAPAGRLRTRQPRPAVVVGGAAAEQLRLDDAAANGEILDDAVDDGPSPSPWTPSFDEADDLGGLLSARSPLLSRAFRTAERSD